MNFQTNDRVTYAGFDCVKSEPGDFAWWRVEDMKQHVNERMQIRMTDLQAFLLLRAKAWKSGEENPNLKSLLA